MGMKKLFNTLFPNPADAVKLSICYLLAALSLGYCFYVAATEGADPHIQVLICILGGAIGWCIGMYLTPSNEGETKKFSEFGKVILLIGAGIGLGKAEDLLEFIKPFLEGEAADTSTLRILLFICSLLIFGQATYIGRLHVLGVDDEKRIKREELIGKIRENLDDLSKF